MQKIWIALACFVFMLLYIVPVLFDGWHRYSVPEKQPQCADKPHFVWNMIPESKFDYHPCTLITRYGRFKYIFENVDGQVFVARNNHIDFPDDMISAEFVTWDYSRQLKHTYDSVVTALFVPYCKGHGYPQKILPRPGVTVTMTSEKNGWMDYYPIHITCGDGTTVVVTNKLLQNKDTSHTE